MEGGVATWLCLLDLSLEIVHEEEAHNEGAVALYTDEHLVSWSVAG